MPLNIKNPVVERLADEVAQLTGESKTLQLHKNARGSSGNGVEYRVAVSL